MTNVLEVEDLHVSFRAYGGEIQAVRGVSFAVRPGETLAIVGESGCGKSVTARAILGMVKAPRGRVKKGSVRLQGRELSCLGKKELQQVRGAQIGMIFQDPMTSLNPTMKIGKQIAEVLIKHQKLAKRQAREKAIELLAAVGIPEPARRYEQYPHECSGGMRQRIVIAIALACDPELIIADEPTTALDVTIQAQILDLWRKYSTTHSIRIQKGCCNRCRAWISRARNGSFRSRAHHPICLRRLRAARLPPDAITRWKCARSTCRKARRFQRSIRPNAGCTIGVRTAWRNW